MCSETEPVGKGVLGMREMTQAVLEMALNGKLPEDLDVVSLAEEQELEPLLPVASSLRDSGHRNLISYSRKVFIPLTQLCRDVCHYCAFAHPPLPGKNAYLTPDEVLEIARAAGEIGVPFTSGILIGIGETRLERIQSLLALRALHRRYGHIQEIIIQNFRAKENTRMAGAPEPDLDDLRWTIAVCRIIFGPEMNIQAPPNLSYDDYPKLIHGGLNDWGGVSPVTPDHVNPEAPWPQLDALARSTKACGKELVERLAIYPAYALDGKRWLDESGRPAVLRAMDSQGLARAEDWCPG